MGEKYEDMQTEFDASLVSTEILTEQALTSFADLTAAPKPLGRNPAAVYLSGLAPGSRRAMQDALNAIAGMLTGGRENALTLDWAALRFQHTAAVRARLQERYQVATVNKALSALRGTLKTAWRLGQMTAEDYHRARDVANVKGETLPAGRALANGEIAMLMAVCLQDEKPIGVRDAALLALLYGCGLRRAEAASLRLEDYDATEGALKVLGKRNKQRLVPVVGGAKEALDAWIRLRGDEPGFLFLPSRKNGRFQPRGMTTQAIYMILQARAEEANVKAFSPHDLRRTFVGDLLDRGADIVTVQKLVGHANVATTARYDRRGEVVKRKAAEMLHVPYGKK